MAFIQDPLEIHSLATISDWSEFYHEQENEIQSQLVCGRDYRTAMDLGRCFESSWMIFLFTHIIDPSFPVIVDVVARVVREHCWYPCTFVFTQAIKFPSNPSRAVTRERAAFPFRNLNPCTILT
jgi:hypothetical protein